MDKTTVLIAVAFALAGLWYVRMRSGGDIDADHQAMHQKDALMVDVRSATEFATGHIDGAINIPVGEIVSRLVEFGDRGRPVVVYCASGMRSRMAKKELISRGFVQVVDLGAMGNW